MQLLDKPCQRLAWAFALAAAIFVSPSWALTVSSRLAPPDLRVDFSKHGSDWTKGSCASRGKQSPIDLNELFKPPSSTFQYMYQEVFGQEVQIINDGRMLSATLVNANMPGGLSLVIAGVPTWYNLTSIDIKSESEHTFRGKHFPLEIQLLHRPAHFYKSSTGPEAVTVSIFVDCISPPNAPQVSPGLLQKGSRRPRRLRSLKQPVLLQQNPEESDALLPPAGEEAEDQDYDPVHQRMDGEINFVRTLVEGEDALAAAGPAPASAASPSGSPAPAGEVYSAPTPMDPNFNPLLQFLVAQEPPDLDAKVITGIGPHMPLRLSALLAGGTYFQYWGSSTLPPCREKDLWLIKREVVMASTAQVKALYDTLHLLSSGAGNYRTSMPLNGRVVDVMAGEEGIPRELRPESDSHEEVVPGKEEKYIDTAKDAITIAKAASDYAKDLDWRIRAASTAHLRAMEAPDVTTPPPTTSAFIPKPPEDQIWATNIMGNIVRKGIHDALKQNIEEMIPATVSLTNSYLRQRILKKAGFGPPPLGAQVTPPKPIPGVPTFFPPNLESELRIMKKKGVNMTEVADQLAASGCTAAANFSGCGNVSGMSPAEAQAVASAVATGGPLPNADDDDDGRIEDEDEGDAQMTPEMVAKTLPPGVQPAPADWPDPDAWPNGLPPANWPVGADPNVWPNPDSAKPAGWSDYQWQRYQYNWRIYRSSYQPYQSHYSRYSISRRRRMSSLTSSGRRRGGGYSSSSRRRGGSSYSSGRRRSSSYSSSSGRRRSSSYSSSSGRRRSRSYGR